MRPISEPRRFAVLSVVLCGMSAAIIVGGLEAFHRYVILPRVEPARINYERYLARSGEVDFIAFGSSEMNMSMNIDSPRFYNLAWRGETLSESYAKFLSLTHEAKRLPCGIFIEVNHARMAIFSTKNLIYNYGSHISRADLRLFREANVPHIPQSFTTNIHSNYKSLYRKFLWAYLSGKELVPDYSKFGLLENGFSFNKSLHSENFIDLTRGIGTADSFGNRVHPLYDLFLRAFITHAQEIGVAVTLVSTPIHKVQRDVDQASGNYAHASQYIDNIAKEYRVYYVDFSRFSDDPADFGNENHMSLGGARRFGRHAESILLGNPRFCIGR